MRSGGGWLRLGASGALTALTLGCGGDRGGRARVETTDSAGVAIVRSVSADLELSFASEPVRSLGGKETPEESFFHVGAWNVAVDGSGNIHVLDREAYRVQVFDSAGVHLRTLGGQGEGPGELQYPFALAAAADGRVWVLDIGKHSLVHWGPEGEVREAGSVPEGYAGGDVTWTHAGLAIPLRDSTGQRLELVPEAGGPTVLASIPAGEVRALQLESCGMGFSGMPPIFSPALTWTARENTVVVARNPEYVLDVYEGGRWIRSLRRDVSPRTATAALAAASLGDGMRVRVQGRGDVVCDPAEVVEQQGFAPFLPMVAQLALAPDRTLWVQRYAVADEATKLDLFDAEGRYLGTLAEGASFPVGFLPDGRILVSEKDEMDVERLVVRTISLERR